MATTTQPTADRLAWLLEAVKVAAERRDWLTASQHADEARAITRNRARFDQSVFNTSWRGWRS